jgi:hypothetical protein
LVIHGYDIVFCVIPQFFYAGLDIFFGQSFGGNFDSPV